MKSPVFDCGCEFPVSSSDCPDSGGCAILYPSAKGQHHAVEPGKCRPDLYALHRESAFRVTCHMTKDHNLCSYALSTSRPQKNLSFAERRRTELW